MSAQQTTTTRPTAGEPGSGGSIGRAPDAARRRWRRLRRDRALLLMVAPAICLLLTFNYVPLLGNVIAFQDYAPFIGIQHSEFVGTANFRTMFDDPAFWQAARNTLEITALQLLLFFPVPIGLALLLNSIFSTVLRRLVQTVVYLPHFLSWVIIVALFQQVVGGAGVLNQVLRSNGASAINIMTNPDLFGLLITTQVIWKDAGWAAIVFLAALGAVDPQQYEAAAVDGAGRWRRLWHVTLPAIRPIIVLLLILRLGEALSVGFEQIVLQRDAVGAGAGEVLDTYVYFTGVINGNWSLAAAAGLCKGVIALMLIVSANRVAHALGEQGLYSR